MKTRLQNNLKERQIKVSSKSFSRIGRENVYFPDIRLCGKWLMDIGFKSGLYVNVAYDADRIIITKV
ncbi:SymE family type I addiction module toxin [Polluticaenibacter yanchengensis]|uniref:Type I addiction module toxin, SymE family n=1 Tax=Polluticaenibacter yanchengensis TaxID=3014562 RepID=A0ABT4UG78_9BACT|nr:hypothetical protein [Chitinophagaceae bacterium LY-5]